MPTSFNQNRGSTVLWVTKEGFFLALPKEGLFGLRGGQSVYLRSCEGRRWSLCVDVLPKLHGRGSSSFSRTKGFIFENLFHVSSFLFPLFISSPFFSIVPAKIFSTFLLPADLFPALSSSRQPFSHPFFSPPSPFPPFLFSPPLYKTRHCMFCFASYLSHLFNHV